MAYQRCASKYHARMRDVVADLITHKHYANAALLEAIGRHPAAAVDEAVRELLQHVLIANRFWLLTVRGEPFVHEQEARWSPSFEELAAGYARLQLEESTWLAAATSPDLHQTLESPLIPGGRCSVIQAWLQVCLHSHGHRAQLAKLLRAHGGEPPVTDFISWLATHPSTP
jgi:uncharacterized damage-inducible protein DinB